MEIRFAMETDRTWLVEHDGHVDERWIDRCLSLNEYIVAEQDRQLAGFLRYSLFWGTIPYMDMVWVSPSRRKAGVGRALFDFWEKRMAENKASVLMTSAMSDEAAPQAWHKKNGFRESGQLTFGAFQETSEIFFVKDLPQR